MDIYLGAAGLNGGGGLMQILSAGAPSRSARGARLVHQPMAFAADARDGPLRISTSPTALAFHESVPCQWVPRRGGLPTWIPLGQRDLLVVAWTHREGVGPLTMAKTDPVPHHSTTSLAHCATSLLARFSLIGRTSYLGERWVPRSASSQILPQYSPGHAWLHLVTPAVAAPNDSGSEATAGSARQHIPLAGLGGVAVSHSRPQFDSNFQPRIGQHHVVVRCNLGLWGSARGGVFLGRAR
ncbi:hypothetical protein B0T24DRAFT_600792 [Lasiosphaeria ovina]|uniref:Uncharacterized protein n=1 Tax=Lasiosphaeria ovina TaxID=92902 RepID=A0AAE0TWS3_9PEZI|nr:hypothetical protein B0T24DRAFT_600792 [Lasiosphaeria ovina]